MATEIIPSDWVEKGVGVNVGDEIQLLVGVTVFVRILLLDCIIVGLGVAVKEISAVWVVKGRLPRSLSSNRPVPVVGVTDPIRVLYELVEATAKLDKEARMSRNVANTTLTNRLIDTSLPQCMYIFYITDANNATVCR